MPRIHIPHSYADVNYAGSTSFRVLGSILSGIQAGDGEDSKGSILPLALFGLVFLPQAKLLPSTSPLLPAPL